MTITELIRELEATRAALGDLTVALHNFDIDFGDSWGAVTGIEIADLRRAQDDYATRAVVLSNDGLAAGIWDTKPEGD